MNLLTLIRDWINERGSSQILRDRVALLQDQINGLVRENSALKAQLAVGAAEKEKLDLRLREQDVEVKHLGKLLEECRNRSNMRAELI